MGEILLTSLRTSVMITGMVVVMMLMIESVNIESHGRWFTALRRSRFGQVTLSAFLGLIPGCMGGFASVSLYSHGMLSFGALVAMMIATSGDESFVMLAMFPKDALLISMLLFVVAVLAGLAVDAVLSRKGVIAPVSCNDMNIHSEDSHQHGRFRHFSWKRLVMLLGLALYIAALATGMLEHGHGEEEWMNLIFSGLSGIMLFVIAFASDHFIDEHLWHHIICDHLPKVFVWTFGILLLIGAGSEFLNLESWVSSNIPLMIVLATLIGIIPESGPHLIFVSMFAMGMIPAPVLVASCISQDGHASLPLIAESKKAFLYAKLINCAVALIIGFGMYWTGIR